MPASASQPPSKPRSPPNESPRILHSFRLSEKGGFGRRISAQCLQKRVKRNFPQKAVKTGMNALPEMMDLIYPYVSKQIPYVMDPVMIATSGDRLVSDEAVNFLKSKLIPVATVITPNRSEAEVLADMSITCESDITTAANRILQDLGPQVVIIKGGHIGKDATDYAFTKDGSVRTWTSPKYDTVHTHGTGCTFSAVITAELAKGRDVMDAIGIAKDYIALAIKHNPGLGNGCGPVNHMAYDLLSNGPETMDELLKNDERR